MTEEEAKSKWCPHARNAAPQDGQYGGSNGNRSDGVPMEGALCIGSQCMAWRWSEAKRTMAFTAAVAERMRQRAKPDFSKALREVYAETGGQFERTEGHCGLAGNPA